MTLDRRGVLTGLAGAGAVALMPRRAWAMPATPLSLRPATPPTFPTLAGRLSIPTAPLLDPERRLTRIGLGSCFNQQKDGALLGTALRSKPDLFLFMGDNVYGDSDSPDLDELVAAYAGALARPDYRRFREALPMAAVWDDHDYGANDAGAAYAYKDRSRPMFFDFWGVPADDPRRRTGGTYDSFISGPKGARVQFILLDTRSFRDAWHPTDKDMAPGRERYIADPDPARTVLGAEQWLWLDHQLRQPADLRILVSSYQLLTDGHGWECWRLFPAERQRLYRLIAKTRAKGVIIVSGDRHRAGIYRDGRGLPYPIHELTSSAINMGFSPRSDPGEEAGPNRLGPTFRQNNVGLVTLDWDRRAIGFHIIDGQDRVVLHHRFGMDDLRP